MTGQRIIVYLYADKVPDREKFLIQAYYYENHSKFADRGKALAAYRAAYAVDSMSVTAQNQLLLNYSQTRQYDSAMKYALREAIGQTLRYSAPFSAIGPLLPTKVS